MTLVSILIAAHNAAEWLAEAIDSALGQSHPHIEVIIVDDGSTDATLVVAEQFETEHVKVITQENLGACAARNRALGEATGEFVKFLDADDVLKLDAVAAQLEALTPYRYDDSIIPYGEMVAVDGFLAPLPRPRMHGPPHRQVFSIYTADRIEALLAYNIQTSLPLHRRNVLLGVGGFREHLKRGQEYDLHLRLAMAGVRFLYVPAPSTHVRQHENAQRITNTSPLLSNPPAYLAVQVERREMIEKELGTPLPETIAAALSRSIWKHTRRLVQADSMHAAKSFVREALLLDPKLRHTGSHSFRLLSSLIGPLSAEQALMKLRSLKRHLGR